MSDLNSADPVPSPAPAPVKRAGGYAALVAAGILLSRIAGLVRTSVFAHYLGATGAADAFNVALKMPNFLQNLLGEGVLSAAFIPVYSRLVSRGEEKAADRVAGVFVSFLALIVAVIVVVGVVAAPWILSITVPGLDPEVMRLAVRLTRIIFPGVGLLVLYAWALGILNTHRQFFIGYVAPVLWNASIITTLVVFGMWFTGAALANALAWGTLVGCALQFGVEVPFVLRHAKHLSFGLDRSLEPVRTIFRNIGPVVGGRGVVQISGYIDTFIASLLPTGAVSTLVYAQTIYMLPISVFGMSVAAAELPQMSAEKGSDEEVYKALRRRLDRGIRQVAFFVVPTTVAFVMIGHVLVAALLERGAFSGRATMIVWYTLIGSSIGLLVSTMSRLYSSTFYALHDTKTPFRVAVIRITISAALALLFTIGWIHPDLIRSLGLPVPPMADSEVPYGVVGITVASGIGSWIEFLRLRSALRRRIGRGESKVSFMTKIWAAAIGAGVVAVIADRLVDPLLKGRIPLASVVEAMAVSAIFGVVYFAAGFAFGVPEVRATLSRFSRT